MPFTQIIAFKRYLDNLGKPLNSTLSEHCVGRVPEKVSKAHAYFIAETAIP